MNDITNAPLNNTVTPFHIQGQFYSSCKKRNKEQVKQGP